MHCNNKWLSSSAWYIKKNELILRHTVCTVDQNRPFLVPLSTSPFDSGFNGSRLRSPCVPCRDTQIRMPWKLRPSWQLTGAINNGRVIWWQFIRGRRPSADIQTLADFTIRSLSTEQSSQCREESDKIQIWAEHNDWPNWETPIWVLAQQHGKVYGWVRS